MTPKQPALLSQLCVDCGLCCSGALFDHAVIKPDEVAFARMIGLDADATSDGARFALPCHFLAGSACTRYGQQRPSICGEFFCELAWRLDDGGIEEAAAHALVAKAKALVADLAPLLLPGEGWVAARSRWHAMGSAPPPDANAARFLFLMTALNLLLDKQFRGKERGQTHFSMADADGPD